MLIGVLQESLGLRELRKWLVEIGLQVKMSAPQQDCLYDDELRSMGKGGLHY